jgi:integrase/recombinase XerD
MDKNDFASLVVVNNSGDSLQQIPRAATASEAIEDYFGARISNANTKTAYLRDASAFALWAQSQNLSLDQVRTVHVAAYRDFLKANAMSASTIKRKISALRKLLSYLVERGALPYNPAREVTTEPVRRLVGKTPALSAEQMHTLFESFNPEILIDLRDRAMIGVTAYTFARVSAVADLKASDFINLGRKCVLRLNEKGGVERDIPVHPKLADYLDSWVEKSGVSGANPLFVSFNHRGTIPTSRRLSRVDLFQMVKRRLKKAGIPEIFSNHSFRATGITEFLSNGGALETAQQIAGHADSRTTKLYDRRLQGIELDEITRIRY